MAGLRSIFGGWDLFVKDPLTGKMEGPYQGNLGESGSGQISYNVYVLDPFGDGFKGPYVGNVQIAGPYDNVLLAFIVLLTIWLGITLWLIYQTVRSTVGAIGCIRSGIKDRAVKFVLIGIVSWILLLGDLFLIAQVFGINEAIQTNYEQGVIERDFYYEIVVPNCDLHLTTCFNGTVTVNVVNDTPYDMTALHNFNPGFCDDIPTKFPWWISAKTNTPVSCHMIPEAAEYLIRITKGDFITYNKVGVGGGFVSVVYINKPIKIIRR